MEPEDDFQFAKPYRNKFAEEFDNLVPDFFIDLTENEPDQEEEEYSEEYDYYNPNRERTVKVNIHLYKLRSYFFDY